MEEVPNNGAINTIYVRINIFSLQLYTLSPWYSLENIFGIFDSILWNGQFICFIRLLLQEGLRKETIQEN